MLSQYSRVDTEENNEHLYQAYERQSSRLELSTLLRITEVLGSIFDTETSDLSSYNPTTSQVRLGAIITDTYFNAITIFCSQNRSGVITRNIRDWQSIQLSYNFPQFLQENAGILPTISLYSFRPHRFLSLLRGYMSSLINHNYIRNKYKKKTLPTRGYKTDEMSYTDLDILDCIVAELQAGTSQQMWFDSRHRQEIFLFSILCRPAVGPSQHPAQQVPASLRYQVKRPGPEADHSLSLVSRLRLHG